MNFLHCLLGLLAFTLLSSGLPAQQFWSQSPGSPSGTARHDDIFFVNETTGWAVKNTLIHKTTDGGETWVQKISKPGTHFRSIGFLSETRGFAGNLGVGSYDGNVSDPNVLYETFDGGENWSVVPGINETGIKGLCAFYVLNATHIYGVGRVRGPAFLIKSTDAGVTWTSVDLTGAGVMNALMDVYFSDPMNGFVIGMDDNPFASNCATPYFGRIARTADGGGTWTTVLTTEGSCSYFWKMSWPTPDVGYVSLQQNGPHDAVVFYKTVDGGDSWTLHEVPFAEIGVSAFYLQGIGFVDEDEGWMGGNGNAAPGNFIHTTDGGLSWSKVGYEDTRRINKIRFVNPLLGFASGTKIHVYRSPLAITGHPQDQSVVEGSEVTLTVTAIGDSPIGFQWRKGESDLSGETGSSLTLQGVAADAGIYTVLVENPGRSLVSRSASISIAPSEGVPFAEWAMALPDGERGEEEDPGGFGIPNLLRYAFGMDAVQPERMGLPAMELRDVMGENGLQVHLALTFTWGKETIGLSWIAEVSNDLTDWSSFDFAEETISDGGGGVDTVTLINLEPMAANQKRFIRVRVEK